jgi:hypothetical protein
MDAACVRLLFCHLLVLDALDRLRRSFSADRPEFDSTESYLVMSVVFVSRLRCAFFLALLRKHEAPPFWIGNTKNDIESQPSLVYRSTFFF